MTDHHELPDDTGRDAPEPIGTVVARLPWLRRDPAPPPAMRLAAADSPIDVLFAALGHDEACRTALRSGAALACQCAKADADKSFAASEATANPVDGAAVVIGLALRYARLLRGRSLPLPRGIVHALVGHVDRGDPAAVMVWQWCVRQGLVSALAEARPRLRVVAGGEVLP